MKNLHQWLSEYEESHKNSVNRAIHKIAVPAIVFSILLMLWPRKILSLPLNAGVYLSVVVLIYYGILSLRFCLAMLFQLGLMMLIIVGMTFWRSGELASIGLIIFIGAWILQFVGHKIEGKKPSFFQDIQFLLIGPLWTLDTLFPGRLRPLPPARPLQSPR
jgi:uncharacterized membrane protein YGL010W